MEENQARRKAEEIALRRLQEQLENQQVKEEAGAGLTSQSSAFHQSVMDEMNDRLKYRDRKVAVSSHVRRKGNIWFIWMLWLMQLVRTNQIYIE